VVLTCLLPSNLQLIVSPLTDLEATETSTSRKNTFSLIQRNAGRLQRLVESILDFSKIESGQFQGRFTPTRLGAFASEVAEVFRSSIEKAKVTYTVESLGDDDRLLYCDRTSPGAASFARSRARLTCSYQTDSMWEKITYNLIGNAFKYCLRGSITVSSIYHPDEFEFRVAGKSLPIQLHRFLELTRRPPPLFDPTDTGVGIPKVLPISLVSASVSALKAELFDPPSLLCRAKFRTSPSGSIGSSRSAARSRGRASVSRCVPSSFKFSAAGSRLIRARRPKARPASRARPSPSSSSTAAATCPRAWSTSPTAPTRAPLSARPTPRA
jgi:hypothetical protein